MVARALEPVAGPRKGRAKVAADPHRVEGAGRRRPNERAVYEAMLGEACDEDELLALVKSYGAAGRTYGGSLARAVQAVTIHQSSVEEGSSWVSLEPASVAALRRQLLAMAAAASCEAPVAHACLSAIDSLRDEYGTVPTDPRHPDLQSGLPWPMES
jgi:hypothetical protein